MEANIRKRINLSSILRKILDIMRLIPEKGSKLLFQHS